MPDVTQTIINKVKLLLKLTSSPNAHEAETARGMADKLIAKYNITEAQLAAEPEAAPLYGEDEKVFSTVGTVGWKQQLVLAIATYFDCQVVVEGILDPTGTPQLSYFAYGDDDLVKDTKFVYSAFNKKVENLVGTRCLGRGPVYIDSYCEGVVESIRWNIQMHGIDIPDIQRPTRKMEEAPVGAVNQLAIIEKEKESPTQNKTNINEGHLIKDVMAYFKGLDDGKAISLKDVLELEVEGEEIDELPPV